MTRFIKYLNEMSETDALELFGLKASEITPAKLKKKYNQLSKIYHPDKGGSDYEQKKVNDAFDTLKSMGKSGSGAGGIDWDAVDKRYQELAKIVKNYLNEKFNTNAFIKYFSEMTGKQITFKMIKSFPDESVKSPHGAGFECEFFDADKNFVFTVHASVNLISISGNKSLGGGDDYSFSIMTESHIFAHNKKHKIGKKTFKNTSNHEILSNPSKLFPKTKLKQIIKGATSKRKFSRRDMILFLEKRLNAKNIDGDEFHIPLSNDMIIVLMRSTMLRQGLWNITMGIYQNRKKVASIKNYFTFEESEETAKKFEELYKELLKYDDPKKVAQVIEKLLDREKALRG